MLKATTNEDGVVGNDCADREALRRETGRCLDTLATFNAATTA